MLTVTTPLQWMKKISMYRSIELHKDILFTIDNFIKVLMSKRNNSSSLYNQFYSHFILQEQLQGKVYKISSSLIFFKTLMAFPKYRGCLNSIVCLFFQTMVLKEYRRDIEEENRIRWWYDSISKMRKSEEWKDEWKEWKDYIKNKQINSQ